MAKNVDQELFTLFTLKCEKGILKKKENSLFQLHRGKGGGILIQSV